MSTVQGRQDLDVWPAGLAGTLAVRDTVAAPAATAATAAPKVVHAPAGA